MRQLSLGTLFTLACACTLLSEYAPNLRLWSELDALMLRLSCRSGMALPIEFFGQPLTAQDALQFFSAVDSVGKLTSRESLEVSQVRRHISGNRFLRWTDPSRKASLIGHMGGNLSAMFRLTDSLAFRTRGLIAPHFGGNVRNFSYFAGVDVWTDFWTDTLFPPSSYQPYDGIPYNLYGRAGRSHVRSSDMVRGGIRYKGTWFSLETAIDYMRQGPAVRYPLTFSGIAPPLTYGRARLELGPMQYSHAFGLLKSQKDKPKYFYTHRIDAPLLGNRMVLGLTEVIVNGSTTDQHDSTGPNALRRDFYGIKRSWEWPYLIPFVPFKFAEHYIGDRDNGLISFDANVHFPLTFRWYAEFLIDDISAPWTLFSNDFGNKWALTAGGQWFGVIRGRDITASIEYTRVEPWVYTHFYGGSHRYDHFNVCLGNPLGPNADALAITLETAVTPRNVFFLSFVNERTNRRARGGNLTDVWQDSMYVANGILYVSPTPDSKRKTFLGKGTQHSTKISLGWDCNRLGICRVRIEAGYETGNTTSGFIGHSRLGFDL